MYDNRPHTHDQKFALHLQLCYPIVTNKAFEAFSYYTFDDGFSCLVADVAISCGTNEHRQVRAIAAIAIFVYPVGLLLLNGFLLLAARKAILQGQPTELSKAIDFLHHEYTPGASTHTCCEAETSGIRDRISLVGARI